MIILLQSQKNNPSDAIRRIKLARNWNSFHEIQASHAYYYTKIRVGKTIVGSVSNGVFTKKIHGRKHLLRKPAAVAYDVQSIEQAKTLGVTWLIIIDLDSGITYEVSLQILLERGFYFNRGYGDQVGLTLNNWQSNKKTTNTQMRLWEVDDGK